jgi:hypothetical protein
MDRSVLQQLAAGVLDGGDVDESERDSLAPAVDGRGGEQVYPDAIRVLAFQIWAYDAGQSPLYTSRILKERTGLDIPLTTVRYWKDTDRWGQLAGEIHQSLMKQTPSQVRAMIQLGTVKAARWMLSVFDNPDIRDEIKSRIALSLLDRGGFPALIRGEFLENFNIGAGAYADLSDDELEAMVYQYRDDGDIVAPEPQTDDKLDRLTHRERLASTDKSPALVRQLHPPR